MPKCLLCHRDEESLIMTKVSHMLPVCLSRYVYGDRNKETVEMAGGMEVGIRDTYYGSQVLQTSDLRVRHPPHTGENIFCRECDTMNLGGLLESKVCANLISQIENHIHSKQDIKSFKISFKKFTNYDLRVFIISIIWRQSLHQELNGNPILSPHVMEHMRKIIFEYLYNGTIVHEEKFPFVIFAPDSIQRQENGNLDDPNSAITNPELFFLGPISVFIQMPGKISTSNFEFPMSILKLLKSRNLKSNPNELMFVPIADWEKLIIEFGMQAYANEEHRFCNRLCNDLNIDYITSMRLMKHSIGLKIKANPSLDVWIALEEAYKELSSNLN